MTTLVWTPYSQSPITFATGGAADYRMLSIDGLSPVTAKVVTSKTPGQHGHTVHDVKIGPRIITVTFLIQGAGIGDLWSKRAALAASVGLETVATLMNFNSGQLLLSRGHSLSDMQIAALCTDLSMPLGPKSSSGISAADITFESPYPFWTPTSDTTVNIPTASTPVDCDNTGDALAPVTYKLGPMISPTVTNVTTGKIFKINNTIPSGKHLLVAIGAKLTILLDDDSTHVKVNWAKYLDHTKKYVTELSPGTNNIEWAPASGSPSGDLDVIYRPPSRGL